MASSLRLQALDILLRVEQDGAFLDRLLESTLRKGEWSPEDRGLLTELCFGVLRHESWLQACCMQHCDRPWKKLDAAVRWGLLLGAYQLLLLDRIPAHAAINESVEAVKRRLRSASGLVNAVLRRVNENAATLRTTHYGRAIDLNLPEPLLAMLDAAWVARAATDIDRDACWRTLQEPAHPVLYLRPAAGDTAAFVDERRAHGYDATAGLAAPRAVHLRRAGDVAALEGFGRDFIVQDEGAQLVVGLAAGEKGPVLDACAAPGGKSVALYDLLGGAAAEIVSVEAQAARVSLLQETLQRSGVTARVVHADARALPPSPAFGVVLLDAPCSGSGTLRRHPELRRRIHRQSVEELAILQRELLQALAARVATGGCFIYSVCSVLEEETTAQRRWFLQHHHDYIEEKTVDTLAQMGQMDGHYAVRFRRVAERSGQGASA